MRRIFFLISILSVSFVWIKDARAAILISEIYPAPESGKYEWVELTNTSNESVNIKDYILRDIALHTLMLPHIVLEKNQFVIATSSGLLNNAGDTVELVLNGTVLESLTYPSGITTNKSYTLCGDEWIITNLISPGFDSQSCLEDEPIVTLSPTLALPSPTRSPTLSINKTTLTATPTQKTSKTTAVTGELQESQPAVLGTQKIVQSFTQKHMPELPTVTPTFMPTLVIRKRDVAPVYNDTQKTYPISAVLTIILVLLLLLAGFVIFNLIKKNRHSTYNEIHDT